MVKITPKLNHAQRRTDNVQKPTAVELARQSRGEGPIGPRKIDTRSFPDQPPHGNMPPLTVNNLRHVLALHDVVVRYNVIKKDMEILLPGHRGTVDNALNVTEAKIVSLVAAHGMSTTHVNQFLLVLADENPFNPAADWIRSKPWDGVDRLPAFYATIQVKDGYPTWFRDVLMRRWLLSAAAAALLPSGFKTRGVLVLQGAQGIGKTSWLKSLVPDPVLADSLVKLDHSFDGGNKDNLLTAIRHWLCELGELGSSFRRDIERVKGILTNDIDKVRQPYARQDSTYPRRTVFMASVNDDTFLVDGTGNRRWLTVRAASINFSHEIDMQQLFAQMARELEQGEQWWLSTEEEDYLDTINLEHMASSVVRDLVRFEGCPYVIPNPATMEPYHSVFHAWDKARKAAGLPDVRMHDLRHSAASNLVNSGQSLYVVGSILGHAQTKTTARYAHLANETLLAAANAAAGHMGTDWARKTG